MLSIKNIGVKLATIASSFNPLKEPFLWRASQEKQFCQKVYKRPFLKGRGVLGNNRKANVEKWELRRLEFFIECLRIVLNAIPWGECENKGRQRGYRLRSNCVNLSYVQMTALKLTCVPSIRLHRPVEKARLHFSSLMSVYLQWAMCLHLTASWFDDIIFHSRPLVKAFAAMCNGKFVIWQQIRAFINPEQWQEFQYSHWSVMVKNSAIGSTLKEIAFRIMFL